MRGDALNAFRNMKVVVGKVLVDCLSTGCVWNGCVALYVRKVSGANF